MLLVMKGFWERLQKYALVWRLWAGAFPKQKWAMTWCCLLFVAASVWDCVYTIYGLKHGISSEVNPLYISYMKLFGHKAGLIYFKAVIVILAIIGLKLAGWCWMRQDKGLAERQIYLSLIFLAGAIYYAYGGLLWLVLDIKDHP